MTEKIRTVVRIAGREYPITSYDGEDYVRRVGAYVDRKIGELALATRLSPLEVTTLAAVSIADDLAKSQEEVTRLKRQIEAQRDEIARLSAEKGEEAWALNCSPRRGISTRWSPPCRTARTRCIWAHSA